MAIETLIWLDGTTSYKTTEQISNFIEYDQELGYYFKCAGSILVFRGNTWMEIEA